MLRMFNDKIDILNTKNMGNSEDVTLIESVLKTSLSYDYLLFLDTCQYVHLKKGKEEIVLFDPLTIIHENSIDILSNIKESLDFLCIGKFVGTERYLIYKNGSDGYKLYDNMDYAEKKLANSLEEFLDI